MREPNDTATACTVRLKSAGLMSLMTVSRLGTVMIGLVLVMITGASAGVFAEETVAERFNKAMKKKVDYCRTHKTAPANRRCDILKLKPADPLATEEGRFAHSIKIPNPVSEDSGYKPGMTSQEYFDHLCKAEAGEFIYKTVENVEGLYMMRPQREATDEELSHLYALEDPYDAIDHPNPQDYLVQPPFGPYQAMESPRTKEDADISGPYVRYVRIPESESKKEYAYMDGTRSHRVPYVVKKEEATLVSSRHGFTWRGISRPQDRKLGIVGGELIVIDLQTNEVLGIRRGFIRSGGVQNPTGIWWLGGQVCPAKRALSSSQFIQKVLKPTPTVK